ncbi:MAG: DUF6306 domain-containing protein [Armatimonadota bacterium]|nr:DUF6306 domain-containing protein [Armatimonadota bacterium]
MSVVDELNDILASERAEVEATRKLIEELRHQAPDLADGLETIHDSARWACAGLYHVINHSGGVPALDIGSLADRLDRETEVVDKLKTLSRHQEAAIRQTKHILNREDMDETAQGLLSEIVSIHQRNRDWLKEKIGEWTPDLERHTA